MNDIAAFIERSADKLGYKREYFVEKNIPTQASNITVIPFYGDVRSMFILSCFVLNQIKKQDPRNYIILCSWAGYQKMFPYVDEYWSIKDKSSVRALAENADNFYNASEVGTSLSRSLIQHFNNVYTYDDLQRYYKNGFQNAYMQDFGGIRRYMPELPGSNVYDRFEQELAAKEGQKILVYPTKKIRSWQKGVSKRLGVQKEFWQHVIQSFIDEGYVPVVYQNYFTYDMSTDFADKCLYLVNEDIIYVLGAMRRIGCVLDMHSGISRLAIAARCPFVCLDERMRFIQEKDYEIDDLCCEKTPKRYVFSLGGLLLHGTPKEWDASFLDNFVKHTKDFTLTLNRDDWMSSKEVDEEVSYDIVRQRVAKRMGVRFIGAKDK